VDETLPCRFAEEIDAGIPYFRHFDIQPFFDRDASQFAHRESGGSAQ
jgi:hypothetical protein